MITCITTDNSIIFISSATNLFNTCLESNSQPFEDSVIVSEPNSENPIERWTSIEEWAGADLGSL